MTQATVPKTILLVEDDDDHAELVQRTFANLGERIRIRRLRDGAQALDYLFERGDYATPGSSTRPELLLLDLRLPKVDGLQVLRQVKESKELRSVPVVILTTSAAEADVARAYVVKPIEFREFSDLLRDLGLFWLVWNTGTLEA